MPAQNFSLEWLQTNRLGSFSMGSMDRIPRRKYHSLLTLREPGFGDSLNTLTEVGESVRIGDKLYLLHNFSYGNHINPQGSQHLVSFSNDPRPLWVYEFGGVRLERELDLDEERDIVRIEYRFSKVRVPLVVNLEPFIVFRPYHHLTRENPFLDGGCKNERDESFSVRPYITLPKLFLKVSEQKSTFIPEGRWDKGIFYSIEHERGYDSVEDFFCPGHFQVEIKKDATFTFHFGAEELKKSTFKKMKRGDSSFEAKLERAADQFLIVKKNGVHSIIAGYPWFEDWGRDTMISLPGLCLATGKLDFAQSILEDYAAVLDKSCAPGAPTVSGIPQNIMGDAPLLFIRAVQLLFEAAGAKAIKKVMPTVYSVLTALKSGADPRVEVTADGGLFFRPGPYAVSWMDVVIDGQPFTPRHGFAVDLNALFLNAVRFALERAKADKEVHFSREFQLIMQNADAAFMRRFWSDKWGFLADVHNGFEADFSLRPNQLWATALPHSPVPPDKARQLIEKVKAHLLTPVGPRTLAPEDSAYRPKYRGGQTERDKAYHQGSVWPWLMGIYADSLQNFFEKTRVELELKNFLDRMKTHLTSEACEGQISEVFDGNEPHHPGGTPAQAWSVAEVLRVSKMLRRRF